METNNELGDIHRESTESEQGSAKQKPTKNQSKKKHDAQKASSYWTVKITIITFFLAAIFSLVAEVTSNNSNIVIASLLLLFLILVSIVFDGIGVSVTSCDLPPLLACASRKVPGAKHAILLVKNAEKVSNICADVIGDICGIVSGACTAALVIMTHDMFPNMKSTLAFSIALSSVVAGLTVGGKAYLKGFAIKNSKDMVLFVGRLMCLIKKDNVKPSQKTKDKKSKAKPTKPNKTHDADQPK